MLAGLQFLAAYLTFAPISGTRWVFPFVFVVALSLYGQLFNETRDLEGDLLAGLKHSAVVLGPLITHWLMLSLLAVASIAAAITIVVDRLFPAWVLILLGVLEGAFILPAAWSARHKRSAMEVQAPFHMPVQHAGAITMVVWFIAPRIDGLWQLYGTRLLQMWGGRLF
jgi:4-hydroxybenzoate polyprenyltransferase